MSDLLEQLRQSLSDIDFSYRRDSENGDMSEETDRWYIETIWELEQAIQDLEDEQNDNT